MSLPARETPQSPVRGTLALLCEREPRHVAAAACAACLRARNHFKTYRCEFVPPLRTAAPPRPWGSRRRPQLGGESCPSPQARR